MPGIVKLGQLRSTTGDTGFNFNTTTKVVEQIAPGDFYINVLGETFTPANKQMIGFFYTGGDQSWVVPAGTTYVFAKLWGSGGGGGTGGGWNHGAEAGGGGHTRGLIPVTGGTTLTIRVPRGGYNNPGNTNAPYGGGSAVSSGDNRYCGGGGGYAGIFIGSQPYLIAGGGGGGGATTSGGMNVNNHGGAGGGLNGQSGWSINGLTEAGRGGTQSAGGTGGTGGSATGQAGSYLQGGSNTSNAYGGGGGGGYYGGGAGSHGSNNMGGGGGGSGYVYSSCLLGETFTGVRDKPAMYEDPDLPKYRSTYTDFARGGDAGNQGGDGYICIYY